MPSLEVSGFRRPRDLHRRLELEVGPFSLHMLSCLIHYLLGVGLDAWPTDVH